MFFILRVFIQDLTNHQISTTADFNFLEITSLLGLLNRNRQNLQDRACTIELADSSVQIHPTTGVRHWVLRTGVELRYNAKQYASTTRIELADLELKILW